MMRRTKWSASAWLVTATLAATTLAVAADPPAPGAKKSAAGTAAAAKFKLVSPDIGQGKTIAEDQVFNGFGCKGKNLSPALFWSGAPAGTKSFALSVYDPDAPTGSGFWHWVVYNIPAGTESLPAEAGDVKKKGMPVGSVQGRTDYGTFGYGGPCPPPGKPHHYYFRLFALKVEKLDVPSDATAALIGFNINANTLAKAELMGLYRR
jgi:Raf kinase inhibitor-like YbhB/YbcL family protein